MSHLECAFKIKLCIAACIGGERGGVSGHPKSKITKVSFIKMLLADACLCCNVINIYCVMDLKEIFLRGAEANLS